VVSALVLVVSLAVNVVLVRQFGTALTVVGFGFLAAALAWTAYATFFEQYPES
jgi:hypothetical protein